MTKTSHNVLQYGIKPGPLSSNVNFLFRDVKLSDFLGKDPIGKMLGYKKKPHPSTFSKVRERADLRIFKDVYDWIVQNRLKGKQIRLFAQDSSDIPAQSKSDKDVKWEHRTPSKREQEDFSGYLLLGYSDCKLYFFLATGLAKKSQHLEEDKYIDVKLFKPAEFLRMVLML